MMNKSIKDEEVLEYRMLSKILLTFQVSSELKSLLKEALYGSDKIELNNLAKSFEYIKIASEIDE